MRYAGQRADWQVAASTCGRKARRRAYLYKRLWRIPPLQHIVQLYQGTHGSGLAWDLDWFRVLLGRPVDRWDRGNGDVAWLLPEPRGRYRLALITICVCNRPMDLRDPSGFCLQSRLKFKNAAAFSFIRYFLAILPISVTYISRVQCKLTG